jgi:hypothetical protein
MQGHPGIGGSCEGLQALQEPPSADNPHNPSFPITLAVRVPVHTKLLAKIVIYTFTHCCVHKHCMEQEHSSATTRRPRSPADQVRINTARVVYSRWRIVFFWAAIIVNFIQVHKNVTSIAINHHCSTACKHRKELRQSFAVFFDSIYPAYFLQYFSLCLSV